MNTSGWAVLSLCDFTGIMVEPWAEAGFDCFCVDLKHSASVTEGKISRISEDVAKFILPEKRWAICFAFPPCTDLTASGARWWKDKGLIRLGESIALVGRCVDLMESTGAPWMLENPIGALSSHWRKPDAQFDPCDYAGYLEDPNLEAYTKKTCLWVSRDFNVPIPQWVFPADGSRMHFISPGPDRATIRSETPKGFAKAVFKANIGSILARISQFAGGLDDERAGQAVARRARAE